MLSQKEMFEHQISQERDELERYPAEEAEELALIYAARGIPLEQARDIAKKLIANPDQALDTLAREELGLNPDDLGSPIGAAISSFIAFCIGASLPLIPFLLGLSRGVLIAACLSGAALFVVGAAAQPLLRQERAARRRAHAADRQRRRGRDLFHRLLVQRFGPMTAPQAKREPFCAGTAFAKTAALAAERTMEPKFATPALRFALRYVGGARDGEGSIVAAIAAGAGPGAGFPSPSVPEAHLFRAGR